MFVLETPRSFSQPYKLMNMLESPAYGYIDIGRITYICLSCRHLPRSTETVEFPAFLRRLLRRNFPIHFLKPPTEAHAMPFYFGEAAEVEPYN